MSFFDKKDKKDNKDNKEEKEGKVLTETNEEGKAPLDTEEKVFETNPSRNVLVKSGVLAMEKIVVIYKKIKPQQGQSRDQFNIYMFNDEGECQMLERDAIIFWKTRKEMANVDVDDITVFGLDEKGEEEFEYSYEDVKDLYKVEEEGLTSSEPRNL